MFQSNTTKYCPKCGGCGQIFDDTDVLEFVFNDLKEKKCDFCCGSGFDVEEYDPYLYSGETVQYLLGDKWKIGMFVKEINTKESLILLGKSLLTVSNDDIVLVNIQEVLPSVHSLENKEYRKYIYSLLGITKQTKK